jgi:PST family polysaccharide transporter
MKKDELISNINFDFNALSKLSLRGGTINISAQILIFLVQFGTLAIMARLISPTDFGVVAMAQSITGFILIFKDLGLSMATVQKDEITIQQVSNLFWINAIIGFLLTLAVIAVSPFVALFFNETVVRNILLISSFGLLVGGLTIQHQALLRRQMKYAQLATVDVVSKLLGSIISIIIALQIRNYWALVLMPLIISSLYLLGIIIVMPWKPKRYRKKAGIRSLIDFGKNMTVYGIINYFARNGDNIIIGKFIGANSLGYYSRAYSLMMLPIGQLIAPLTGVMIPTLSRLQTKPDEFRKYFKNLITLIAFLTLPLIATLGILGEEVVLIVLGNDWSESILLYKILCIAAFWQPILNSTGWILTSLGQTKRLLHWGIINSSLLILSFFIGVQWGVIGLSVGYAIYYWLILIPYFYYVTKHTPVRLKDLFDSVKSPIIYTIIISSSVFLFTYFYNGSSLILKVLISIIIFLLNWLIIYFVDVKIKKQITQLIEHFKN